MGQIHIPRYAVNQRGSLYCSGDALLASTVIRDRSDLRSLMIIVYTEFSLWASYASRRTSAVLFRLYLSVKKHNKEQRRYILIVIKVIQGAKD